jgi:hypothetical protein
MLMKDGNDLFLVIDGVKIAKRGHPGTPHAMTWISLEPGYSVITTADQSAIEVTYQDAGRAVS